MDKVQEIMALVGEYGSMVKCEQFDECDDIYSEIESKLRALLERKPLDEHQRMEVLHAIPDDDDAEEEWMLTDKQIQLIIDGVERAHDIKGA